jgi:hypothetical protein
MPPWDPRAPSRRSHMTEVAKTRIAEAIDAIEEAYEYFLAYAAQGIVDESQSSALGARLRDHLSRTTAAIADLTPALGTLLETEEIESGAQIQVFQSVVEADAQRAAAVVGLVESRASISSQLIDNLNASVHVRTLLTDLFLLDEILKLGVDQATAPEEPEQVT